MVIGRGAYPGNLGGRKSPAAPRHESFPDVPLQREGEGREASPGQRGGTGTCPKRLHTGRCDSNSWPPAFRPLRNLLRTCEKLGAVSKLKTHICCGNVSYNISSCCPIDDPKPRAVHTSQPMNILVA